ncbi:protein yellow-like [Venturia canescens]|uniref:protein yellow-like n=1 Tax=Venturia canescens TaxID=32260 RepID=UPI001C9C73FD|nr:protein yellow-like [Venturia canescens]
MTLLKLALFGLVVVSCRALDDRFQEIFRWNTIDVVWPSEEAQTKAYDRNEYIPENNPIAGIKVWKDKMFLTVPRWKEGVPVTLGVTSAIPVRGVYAPKLEAYPNWDMQTVGDCRAFQFVQSMEIDPKGRMWVLDSGRTETMTLQAKARCPPRLVILDLENKGQVLRSYQFPPHVTPPESSYLNDIVLDHEDGGMAYITDTAENDPGIIVFSLRNGTSWKIRDSSMKAEDDAVGFKVLNVHVIQPVHVDGIALSPASAPERHVYYSPLSSFYLFSLPTWVMKTPNPNVHDYVRELGRKQSQTDGMIMSSSGVLYFGLLADDGISMWNTSSNTPSFNNGQRLISRDHEKMQWPDTFAYDERGNLYCVTNSLQNFIVGRVNTSVPNYRVIRLRTNHKSYQYYDDSTAPELPVIVAGADRISVAIGTCVAVLLAVIMK